VYFDLGNKRYFATTGGKSFDESRPCVVFLHGSALDHTFWSLQSRYFAFRHYSVLAPDLPGHGASAGPCLENIEAMADWLHDVAESLGVENISLVGHSQGSLVALEFAARFPQRVRSVSFICSGLATPVKPALIDAAANAPERAIDMMVSWGFGAAGHFSRGPVPGYLMLAGGQKVMRRNGRDALLADLRACNAYANGAAAASAVTAATQVIFAGQDRMAPRKAVMQLVRHLKDPVVNEIPGSGHMLPLEAPDECRRLLGDFVFRNNPAA
jgi:pimeloyl-ACP methyl ester carboxylesterase